MENGEEKKSGAEFGISSFYGKNRPSCSTGKIHQQLLRIAKTEQHVKEHPLPYYVIPRVLGPTTTWKTFSKQSDAILFARRHGSGAMVWSYEGEAIGEAGKRGFAVAHPSVMWITQMGRPHLQRNNYEVIQEGAVCKLYFDLEFLYKYNKGKNGVKMTEIFIKVVCYFLYKEFGVVCSEYDVLNLTCANKEKYSCHLIFNIEKHAFANNIYAGNFVIMICNKLLLWHSIRANEIDSVSVEELNSLFIKDKENTELLFVDQGVYTKNRNFRVYKSTKFGKNSPLNIADNNKFSPKIQPLPSSSQIIDEEQQLFLDSLITRVSEECTILTYGENSHKVRNGNNFGNSDNKAELEGYSSSPYPEIDEFIKTQIGKGNIRCWYYYTDKEILIYEIGHYRYCYNVGREHKSNGIFFVVNLKEAHYYQKCHDTDCYGFRSAPQQLPESTMFWKHINDDCDENFDEEEDLAMIMAATQVEQLQKSNEMSDEELIVAATAVEQELISKHSNFGSHPHQISSQEMKEYGHVSSQENTIWDNLSTISTPNISAFNSQSDTQPNQINSQEIMDCGYVFSPTNTVWDNLSLISSPNSSAFNSQSNTQPSQMNSQEIMESVNISSETNNVWDNLSSISTPNSSAFNSQSNDPSSSQEIYETNVFQENLKMESYDFAVVAESIENNISNTAEQLEICGLDSQNK